MYRRLPYWRRPTFHTEAVGERAAYEEAEIERRRRLENMSPEDVNHQQRLPLLGGPLDGGTFRVPTAMLRRGSGGAGVEIPIRVPDDGGPKVLLPDGRPARGKWAVYRLDRRERLLRFVRVERS
jgi:hypothetical protein